MTCSIPDCPNIAERSGVCASDAREIRKNHANSLKPPKTKKPIDKVGKKNTFECSDGERVNQAYVNSMRDLCYKLMEEYQPFSCEGCNAKQWQGHAHIIPQAICKQLGKTELIWNPENIFFACHNCNAIAENVSSAAITKLLNYPRIKSYLELNNYERFCKLPDYSIANEPHIL